MVSLRNKSNRLEELFIRVVGASDAEVGGMSGDSRAEPIDEADARRSPCDERASFDTSRPVALVALRTIVRKEIRRFLRIWTQTIMPPAITMTLYLLIFGNLIGEPDRRDGRHPLHGVHRARRDHDGRHHQLVLERGVLVLRGPVPAVRGGDAGVAHARITSSSSATWPAASRGVSPSVRS